MKTASKLAATLSPEESLASKMPELRHLADDSEDESDPVDHSVFSVATLQDDNEYLGVGATSVEDVIGLNFLDSFRSQVPVKYEDYPQYGLSSEYFALELEFDA